MGHDGTITKPLGQIKRPEVEFPRYPGLTGLRASWSPNSSGAWLVLLVTDPGLVYALLTQEAPLTSRKGQLHRQPRVLATRECTTTWESIST
jgi:hypothetical protein